jgi:hypothetical protein
MTGTDGDEVTVQRAADLCGVSRSWVQNRLDRKELASRRTKNVRLVRLAEVKALVAAQTGAGCHQLPEVPDPDLLVTAREGVGGEGLGHGAGGSWGAGGAGAGATGAGSGRSSNGIPCASSTARRSTRLPSGATRSRASIPAPSELIASPRALAFAGGSVFHRGQGASSASPKFSAA